MTKKQIHQQKQARKVAVIEAVSRRNESIEAFRHYLTFCSEELLLSELERAYTIERSQAINTELLNRSLV